MFPAVCVDETEVTLPLGNGFKITPTGGQPALTGPPSNGSRRKERKRGRRREAITRTLKYEYLSIKRTTPSTSNLKEIWLKSMWPEIRRGQGSRTGDQAHLPGRTGAGLESVNGPRVPQEMMGTPEHHHSGEQDRSPGTGQVPIRHAGSRRQGLLVHWRVLGYRPDDQARPHRLLRRR
jgi:hypothetical protein